MAKASRLAGATSNIFLIFIQDSTSTTGAGKTGLLFSGITGYYKRSNGTAAVQITMATITTLGTFATGGLKEVDATNMPGLYEVHPPDAAFASGAKNVVIMYKGGTNMAPVVIEIELTATDNQDGVRAGMTALPNAAAGAANGLHILGTNATAVSYTAGMTFSNAGGDAFTCSSGGSNGNGIKASGNGTGSGIAATSGAGATGDGIVATAASTNGNGLNAIKTGTGIPITGVFGETFATGFTAKQTINTIAAAAAGKVSGLATNAPVFRDLADSKNVITATTDASGNRSAITYNP